MFWNKGTYIKALDNVLEVRQDHKELTYHKDNDGEYMKLSSVIGNVWWFDITGHDESRILQTIATLLAGKKPCNLITDTARLMRIASGSTLMG